MADSITRHFAGLADPRSGQGRRHELTDLMAITVLAVVCWAEFEDFGNAKRPWLATFLMLPHGIASHDTFGRVFTDLDLKMLERCLTR